MLSDEEKKAIKVLNNFNPVDCGREDTQAIETILNLIEKQSKEIEEYQIGFAQGCYEKDLDWKDKIKAKIEEYEDYGTSIYYGLRSNGKAFHQAVRMEVKEVLQSLLEKE